MTEFRRPIVPADAPTGTFLTIAHPAVAEILALSGVDFIAVDCEHTGIDQAELRGVIVAADAHRTPVLVRVAPGQLHQAALALNAGAAGIIYSRISSVAEAVRAVETARFPPLGRRALAPSRAAGFGADMASYAEGANNALLVCAHIGTSEGLAALDEIAGVPGIDLLFVGPSDVRAVVAAMPETDSLSFDQAMDRAVETARKHGKRTGTFAVSRQEAEMWRSRGFDLVVLASDGLLLAQAARTAFV